MGTSYIIINLLASDGTKNDVFGTSVLVSIDSIYGLAIVGAYKVDDNIGASYIYQRDDESRIWNEATILTRTNDNDRYFGSSAAIYCSVCIREWRCSI